MAPLVFASSNKNKIKEIQLLLPRPIALLSLEDIGCHEDIAETAPTIEGNAMLKADYVTKNYGYDCFADDSGLEVRSLNGAPGVISARYAGEHKEDQANMDKLLSELRDKPDRKAQFKTVICLNLNGRQHLFTGIAEGKIAENKMGNGGFGYDPIFIPDGFSESFAQLPLQTKNEISHRGKAVRLLLEFLKEQHL
ncbi:MAG TPA: non-canonical purine NTP diphosphatase [Flavobacterium sp.]|nr:non-canonical purine NTP diphosphatase [Flavobacterium sp.]